MATFLRLELAGRAGDTILLNVDHIVRIHPSWPHGSTIVTTEPDAPSLHVRPSLDEIQARLTATNGRTTVLKVEHKACGDIDAVYEAARADLLP